MEDLNFTKRCNLSVKSSRKFNHLAQVLASAYVIINRVSALKFVRTRGNNRFLLSEISFVGALERFRGRPLQEHYATFFVCHSLHPVVFPFLRLEFCSWYLHILILKNISIFIFKNFWILCHRLHILQDDQNVDPVGQSDVISEEYFTLVRSGTRQQTKMSHIFITV